MTRITFYSNLADKSQMLIHLIQQALNKRRQVTVLAETQQQAQILSDVLWQSARTTFLPNVLIEDALAIKTPVIIDSLHQTFYHDDILINFSSRQPTAYSRFRHLIELVSLDEDEKTLARQRFKFYRDRGYDIKHIDQSDLSQA